MSSFLFVKKINKKRVNKYIETPYSIDQDFTFQSKLVEAVNTPHSLGTSILYIDEQENRAATLLLIDPKTGIPLWENVCDLKVKN